MQHIVKLYATHRQASCKWLGLGGSITPHTCYPFPVPSCRRISGDYQASHQPAVIAALCEHACTLRLLRTHAFASLCMHKLCGITCRVSFMSENELIAVVTVHRLQVI